MGMRILSLQDRRKMLRIAVLKFNPSGRICFLQRQEVLESNNRKMNAKSLLGIMSLSVITGATVTLSAVGPDAEAAVNALEQLLQRDVY